MAYHLKKKKKKKNAHVVQMYKTDKTRQLIEMNSFLPNLTKVEFKEIYSKSYIGSPKSNFVFTKPNIKQIVSPRMSSKNKSPKNSALNQTTLMEKSYSRRNQKKNQSIKLRSINE